MTEAVIMAALTPADFGVSVICVGEPVECDEQDVQEEDMEEEDMEEVGDMGESDGLESSEEAVLDLTRSSEDTVGAVRGDRLRTPSCHVSGGWSAR